MLTAGSTVTGELRRRIGEEVRVRGQGQIDGAATLRHLQIDIGSVGVLTRLGVHIRVPHHRRRQHTDLLAGIGVQERHRTICALARALMPFASSVSVTEPFAAIAERSFSSKNCSKPVRVDSMIRSVDVRALG